MATDDDRDDPVLLVDETADGEASSDLDAGETGSSVLGEQGDTDDLGDEAEGPGLGPPSQWQAMDDVPVAAEDAAVHVVDDEAG
jgi:hypothetical protein